jgi:predicted RNA binding protein YcfA (HicA-like mRNA interferase family)
MSRSRVRIALTVTPDARKPPPHATRGGPDATALAAARAAGIEEGKRLAGVDFDRGLQEGHRRGLRDAAMAVEGALGALAHGTDLPVAPAEVRTPLPEALMPPLQRSRRRASKPKLDRAEGGIEGPPGELPAGHQKILDALAWFEASRISAPSRQQVAWGAGYRADTGHFGNVLTDLAKWTLVERKGSHLALTDDGRQRTVPPKVKVTAAILVERIKTKISGPAGKVLDELVRAYPRAVPREDLAAATGYRADTGHFGNIITELTVPEIATRPGRGEVRLADWVMLK